MALTVLPIEEYESLVKGGTNEAKHMKFRFDWNVVEKDYARSYRDIITYMSTTDVKLIGAGSGRTAFFLPPGDWKKDKTTPVCFKVAKNKKGVAQNKVEINLFNKYGKTYTCFPELFEYDRKNQYYMLTEVGRPLQDDELKHYFKMWNEYIEDMLMNSDGTEPFYYFSETGANFDFTNHIYEICEGLNERGRVRGWYENKEEVVEDIERISSQFPQYKTITDLIRFSIEGGWNEVVYDDFAMNDSNWAMLVRNGTQYLLPIDYGFSDEVAKQFYRK